jgi:addiction module RelB/DinJ family antitoxin
MDSTTFNLRLPKALKKNAQAIIEKNGLDLPSAVRLFLSHVVSRGTIPLQWITVNGFTEEVEQKILDQRKKKDVIKTLKSDKDISMFIDEL